MRMARVWSEEQRNTGFPLHRTLAVRSVDASRWGKERPEGQPHVWMIEETNFKYWTEVSLNSLNFDVYDYSLDLV